MRKKKTNAPLPAFNEWQIIGKAMAKIEFWSRSYDFQFQFWGNDNNNVFIEKDGVEIGSFGGRETIKEVLDDTIEWCEEANPSVAYPAGIDISNPQP